MPKHINLDAFDLVARHVDDEMSEELRRAVLRQEIDIAAAVKKLRKAAGK